MTRGKFILIIGLTTFVTACKDKAKSSYDECLQAETVANWNLAIWACNQATTLDPKSTSGIAAASKLPSLEEKLAAQEKATADAKAAVKAKQDADDAKCPRWETICTLGHFSDGSEQTTGLETFGTKSECLAAGTSHGLNIPCDTCRCSP